MNLSGIKRKATTSVANSDPLHQPELVWGCPLCNVSTTCEQFLEHVQSNQHKVMEALFVSQRTLATKASSVDGLKEMDAPLSTMLLQKQSFYCNVCEMKCWSKSVLNFHLKGKKHIAQIKKLVKLHGVESTLAEEENTPRNVKPVAAEQSGEDNSHVTMQDSQIEVTVTVEENSRSLTTIETSGKEDKHVTVVESGNDRRPITIEGSEMKDKTVTAEESGKDNMIVTIKGSGMVDKPIMILESGKDNGLATIEGSGKNNGIVTVDGSGKEEQPIIVEKSANSDIPVTIEGYENEEKPLTVEESGRDDASVTIEDSGKKDRTFMIKESENTCMTSAGKEVVGKTIKEEEDTQGKLLKNLSGIEKPATSVATSDPLQQPDLRWWCPICKVSSSCEQFWEHIQGKQHKSMEPLFVAQRKEAAKASAAYRLKEVDTPLSRKILLKEQKQYFNCDVCELKCCSESMLNSHLNGKKHKAQIKKLIEVRGDKPTLTEEVKTLRNVKPVAAEQSREGNSHVTIQGYRMEDIVTVEEYRKNNSLTTIDASGKDNRHVTVSESGNDYIAGSSMEDKTVTVEESGKDNMIVTIEGSGVEDKPIMIVESGKDNIRITIENSGEDKGVVTTERSGKEEKPVTIEEFGKDDSPIIIEGSQNADKPLTVEESGRDKLPVTIDGSRTEDIPFMIEESGNTCMPTIGKQLVEETIKEKSDTQGKLPKKIKRKATTTIAASVPLHQSELAANVITSCMQFLEQGQGNKHKDVEAPFISHTGVTGKASPADRSKEVDKPFSRKFLVKDQKQSFDCDICKLKLCSQSVLNSHLNGKKHRTQIKKLDKVQDGKPSTTEEVNKLGNGNPVTAEKPGKGNIHFTIVGSRMEDAVMVEDYGKKNSLTAIEVSRKEDKHVTVEESGQDNMIATIEGSGVEDKPVIEEPTKNKSRVTNESSGKEDKPVTVRVKDNELVIIEGSGKEEKPVAVEESGKDDSSVTTKGSENENMPLIVEESWRDNTPVTNEGPGKEGKPFMTEESRKVYMPTIGKEAVEETTNEQSDTGKQSDTQVNLLKELSGFKRKATTSVVGSDPLQHPQLRLCSPLCNVSTCWEKIFEYIQGKKHKAGEASFNSQTRVADEASPADRSKEVDKPLSRKFRVKDRKQSFDCDVCKLKLCSQSVLNSHLNGKKHRALIKKLNTLHHVNDKSTATEDYKTGNMKPVTAEEFGNGNSRDNTIEGSGKEDKPFTTVESGNTSTPTVGNKAGEETINKQSYTQDKLPKKLSGIKRKADTNVAATDPLRQPDVILCSPLDNVSTSCEQFLAHSQGKKHKAMETSETKIADKAPRADGSEEVAEPFSKKLHMKVPKQSFDCEVCKVKCCNQSVLNSHLNGRKHKARIKKFSMVHSDKPITAEEEITIGIGEPVSAEQRGNGDSRVTAEDSGGDKGLLLPLWGLEKKRDPERMTNLLPLKVPKVDDNCKTHRFQEMEYKVLIQSSENNNNPLPDEVSGRDNPPVTPEGSGKDDKPFTIEESGNACPPTVGKDVEEETIKDNRLLRSSPTQF